MAASHPPGSAASEGPRPWTHHLPNALTIARLIALPVFWWLLITSEDGQSFAAGVIFAVACLTDWFDGWLARRQGSVSRFGRIADPLADRLLIDSAVILLWWQDRLPLLAPILIIGRDVVLMLGLRSAAKQGYELSVILLGKTATAVLMFGLGMIMFTEPGTEWPVVLFWIGLGLAIAAGIVYAITVRGRLRAGHLGEEPSTRD